MVAEALRVEGGMDAATLHVAEKYVSAFGELAKSSTTMLLPASPSDPASLVAQAMGIVKAVSASGVGAEAASRGRPAESQPSGGGTASEAAARSSAKLGNPAGWAAAAGFDAGKESGSSTHGSSGGSNSGSERPEAPVVFSMQRQD